ncbi:MAG: phosphatase PAP2 family protein [Campylobacterales bacterium]|nr:phosphatase PAP2 family protein [Campylobacterales bacterium]
MFSKIQKLLLVLLLSSLPLFADQYYIDKNAVNLIELLAPPPKSGSLEDKEDLKGVLKAQNKRTKGQSERALADANLSVFRFADVIGSDFVPAKLPLTTALFEKLKSDGDEMVRMVKDSYKRPRPFLANSAVHSLKPDTKGASYPSGHTTFAYECAVILSKMVPEKRYEIFMRAEEYSQNRVVLGVHYPADIRAGRGSGTLLANEFLKNEKFIADFEAAKAELRSVLGLK